MRISRTLAKLLQTTVEWASLPLRGISHVTSRLIGLFHYQGVGNRGVEESLFKKAIKLLLRVLLSPISIPLHLFRTRKPSELLVALPTIAMLGLIAFIGFRVVFSSDTTQRLYYLGARKAIANDNLALSQRYFERIDAHGDMSDQMTHDWAVVLNMNGKSERSTRLLNKISPNGESGFPAGHRTQAIRLVQEIQKGDGAPDANSLDELHWHLKHAIASTQTDQAWGQYYLFCDQPEEAVKYLSKAAVDFPQLYFSLADILNDLGRESEYVASLQNASERFQDLLKRDPLDQQARIALSNALDQRILDSAG